MFKASVQEAPGTIRIGSLGNWFAAALDRGKMTAGWGMVAAVRAADDGDVHRREQVCQEGRAG